VVRPDSEYHVAASVSGISTPSTIYVELSGTLDTGKTFNVSRITTVEPYATKILQLDVRKRVHARPFPFMIAISLLAKLLLPWLEPWERERERERERSLDKRVSFVLNCMKFSDARSAKPHQGDTRSSHAAYRGSISTNPKRSITFTRATPFSSKPIGRFTNPATESCFGVWYWIRD